MPHRFRFRKMILVLVCLLLVLLCTNPTPVRAVADGRPDEKPLLSFAVFSDTHVMESWSPSHLMSVRKFTRALQDIEPLHPDFLVINGDLTNGRLDDYNLLKKLYKQHASYPLYPTMGNHDYYKEWTDKAWTDKKAQQQFMEAFHLPHLYYDKFVKGVHLIFLSPEQYKPKQKEIGEAAWLSQAQIRWFEKTLLSSRAPTFVFLHQPLTGTVFNVDLHSISTVQTAQLLAIARQHPQVVWFSGHSHVSADAPTEVVRKDGILFVGLGSVILPEDMTKHPVPGAQKYGDVYLRADKEKSQSRFVQVYSDRIVIRTREHHSASWSPSVLIEPLRSFWQHLWNRLTS